MPFLGITVGRPSSRLANQGQPDRQPDPIELIHAAEISTTGRTEMLAEFIDSVGRLAAKDPQLALGRSEVAVNNLNPEIRRAGLTALLDVVEARPTTGLPTLTRILKQHADASVDNPQMIARMKSVWTNSANAYCENVDALWNQEEVAVHAARSLLEHKELGETAADFLVLHDQSAIAPATLHPRTLPIVRVQGGSPRS